MTAEFKRSCGGCTLCCTEMAVSEISKPMCSKCPSQTATGCGIYEIRPKSCADFTCMWMDEPPAGIPHPLAEEERPDRCGVMFHAASDAFTRETGIPMLVVRGDFVKGADTLARLAGMVVLILVHASGRRQLMGPEEWVREVAKAKIKEFE